MAYTRVIGILSGKGGVGKTTLTFNLGAAMTDLGMNVAIVDGNVTTPNLSIHAGLAPGNISLHDVLKGRVDIYDVMKLLPSGMKIIPASLNVSDLEGTNPMYLGSRLRDLLGRLDYILIDGAPGLGGEAMGVLGASHEIIGVSTPDLPALTDLLKSIELIKKSDRSYLGTVINMHRNKPYETKKEHVLSLLEETPILETIPDDDNMRYALSKRMPVIHFKPHGRSSLKIMKLAAGITGRAYQIPWHRKLRSYLDFV
ncbi:MAG: P-loop NTPase [Candidatus Aenigmarchaeota archaeon]|nr:P-loop NTPase [Candidatus Aenigmarchaeota archaeon]